MKYIQLKKMFHIDENKCNELYFKITYEKNI